MQCAAVAILQSEQVFKLRYEASSLCLSLYSSLLSAASLLLLARVSSFSFVSLFIEANCGQFLDPGKKKKEEASSQRARIIGFSQRFSFPAVIVFFNFFISSAPEV